MKPNVDAIVFRGQLIFRVPKTPVQSRQAVMKRESRICMSEESRTTKAEEGLHISRQGQYPSRIALTCDMRDKYMLPSSGQAIMLDGVRGW